MNKKAWIIISIVILLGVGIATYFYFSNNQGNNKSQYFTNKTSTQNNTNRENINTNSNNSNTDNTNNNTTDTSNNTSNEVNKAIHETEKKSPIEEQLSTFTTKIYSKDSARQNNINITCNTLNNTIVKNGKTFSFCNTVGQASSSKGYQEADIIDNNR